MKSLIKRKRPIKGSERLTVLRIIKYGKLLAIKKAIKQNMKKQPSLQLCLLMDAIGCITFLIPVIGEAFDIVWAPISAIIFYFAFGGRKAMYGAAFNLVEEIVPFMNFIPTFTIAWLWQKYMVKKPSNNVIEIKPA